LHASISRNLSSRHVPLLTDICSGALELNLTELFVYPLKGARGISLPNADVLPGGLRHDRRFMLVDVENQFITQRSHPALALVTTTLHPAALTLGVRSGESATVPLAPEGRRRSVTVWGDTVAAIEVDGPAGELISEHLGVKCSLVYVPEDAERPVESPYGKPGDRVGFADAYPVLLATYASLLDLNQRLDVPVPMSRFRPNLVVQGGAAFDEERFGSAAVGAVTFRMPKRCARCSVTTVDQDTAAVGKEPLRTLASYRKEQNQVYFAQNLIPDGSGELRVGDPVTYLDPLA
jgi:uncharacterized protein YcbX